MEQILGYMQENSGTGTSTTSLLMYVAMGVGLWKMFEKAGQPGWIGLVPFYNLYKLCEITRGDGWYFLRLFLVCIPYIGWIFGLYYMYKIAQGTAQSFGQDPAWALGYFFLSPIFYCITGFGKYDYYGVAGIGDNRTAEAREAKTVNFDVIKNEPDSAAKADPVQEVNTNTDTNEAEEEVEFVFDQSEVE